MGDTDLGKEMSWVYDFEGCGIWGKPFWNHFHIQSMWVMGIRRLGYTILWNISHSGCTVMGNSTFGGYVIGQLDILGIASLGTRHSRYATVEKYGNVPNRY